MIQIFVPYDKETDFWFDIGEVRGPSDSFWKWAEDILGQRAQLGDDPNTTDTWSLEPYCMQISIQSDELDSNKYSNGRLLKFFHPAHALLFKLRWF